MTPERTDFSTILNTIDEISQNGGLAVGSLHPTHVEYVCVFEEDQASVYNSSTRFTLEPEKMFLDVESEEIKALTVVGVTRRIGLVRRFIEAQPHEILPGDKVVLEDREGERYKTGRINTIVPKVKLDAQVATVMTELQTH